MAKKKTKCAFEMVQEVMGREDEFAWEYSRFVRSECFCKEEEACCMSAVERDTVRIALDRVQRLFSISDSSVRRLFRLAVEKKVVRESVLPHLEEDKSACPSPYHEAHRGLKWLGLDDIGCGLYGLVWEYIPTERICESSAPRELKIWQMMARFIESRAQGIRDGF